MKLFTTFGIVGSRAFTNYDQLKRELSARFQADDEVVSGGASGVDSMAQRFCKEQGYNIHIYYPKYAHFGPGATFIRNKIIVEHSDIVIAFYAKGRFQQGGTANSISWCQKLGVPFIEFEEE